MNRRIDFYDDPQAPAANSLVPSVNVVVVNDEGSILFHRTDRACPRRAADAGQRVQRGPLDTGIGRSQVHDGPVDAQPHQRRPGPRQIAGRYLSRASGSRVGGHFEQVTADVRDELEFAA